MVTTILRERFHDRWQLVEPCGVSVGDDLVGRPHRERRASCGLLMGRDSITSLGQRQAGACRSAQSSVTGRTWPGSCQPTWTPPLVPLAVTRSTCHCPVPVRRWSTRRAGAGRRVTPTFARFPVRRLLGRLLFDLQYPSGAVSWPLRRGCPLVAQAGTNWAVDRLWAGFAEGGKVDRVSRVIPLGLFDEHRGPATVEALLITGTVGVGKTTTARVIGEQLQKLGIPHAVIDQDELARGWPAPAEDRFNMELELTNWPAWRRTTVLLGRCVWSFLEQLRAAPPHADESAYGDADEAVSAQDRFGTRPGAAD